jgi:hypothetical protein
MVEGFDRWFWRVSFAIVIGLGVLDVIVLIGMALS